MTIMPALRVIPVEEGHVSLVLLWSATTIISVLMTDVMKRLGASILTITLPVMTTMSAPRVIPVEEGPASLVRL